MTTTKHGDTKRMKSPSESAWEDDKRCNGWELPTPAHWVLRLPVIRNFRAIGLAIQIYKHEALMYRLGFGISTGYDQWVLYAIKRGWC